MKSKKNKLSIHHLPKLIWAAFILLVLIGLYLRFYNIESVQSFGWDQARDAWVVRDILLGNFSLIGPRTGIGHMHLGPVYYYLLAPFYFFTNLDPSGANYFNILMNIFNFAVIFWVVKKLYGNYAALFATLVYTTSHYLITLNQVPWNVTMMPGFALLILYAIVQVYKDNYKWIFVLWAISGFYFNLHFSAIFLPIINILSLLFVKDRKKVILYSLYSIPLYLIWFVPNIVHGVITGGGDSGLLKSFFADYAMRPNVQFMLHRLSSAVIQFDRILYDPLLKFTMYFFIPAFIGFAFFEKDKQQKLLCYLILLWFAIPWIGFSMYKGPISEYYFLYNAPMVLLIFIYVQKKLLVIKLIPVLILLIAFWSFYIIQNTKDLWVKPNYGGLAKQKDEVKADIKNGKVYTYNEGDIKSYLYEIWEKAK